MPNAVVSGTNYATSTARPAEVSMNGQIKASILGIAAAVTLVACASQGPVNSTPLAAAGGAGLDQTASEYQSLIDNATSPVVCRREPVTGSRIHKREVCLTAAQMDAERENALRWVNDMRMRAATTMPQPMPSRSVMPVPMPSQP
jgi:hypothetical protein